MLSDVLHRRDSLRCAALPADDAANLARGLRVLADPARLRLLSLIQSQPDHEACVCHLTEPLGLSQPTVSHHLKVLLEAGLVERDQREAGPTSALFPSRWPVSESFSPERSDYLPAEAGEVDARACKESGADGHDVGRCA